MNEYVRSETGKQLRMGFTTGSSATAATKAALLALLGTPCTTVTITLPDLSHIRIPIKDVYKDKDTATAVVVKDSGDDADVTHGIEIVASVSWTDQRGTLIIRGGEGVGVVTKQGLQIPVGEAAINPVPRQMMIDNALPFLPDDKGLCVVISVPQGAEVARKTFNERLGVIGGISIIGTSGRVRPMSDEAFMDAILVELKQKKALGIVDIVLVPGKHGELFAVNQLGLDASHVVHMGNYVGFCLNACASLHFKSILLVGHIGKLIKLAGGIFNTLGRLADAKAEIIMAHLALQGAPLHVIKGVYQANTTDEMSDFIAEMGYLSVFKPLSLACVQKCKAAVTEPIDVQVVLYDMKKRLLADTRGYKNEN